MPATKKRWFSELWSEPQIVGVVEHIARNPLLVLPARGGGFVNCYGEINGVRIKVRVTPGGAIITGHPIDGDGVVQVEVRSDGEVILKEIPYGRSDEVVW